ncbi:MAG: YybH family protein [Bacteroidota bacterium]
MPHQTKRIEVLVEGLNQLWIQEKFDELGNYFHNKAVMIKPGSLDTITGRSAIVESYEEFMSEAEVSDFKIADMDIHVFEHTAIVIYTFRIRYQVETTRYDEKGTETLVFNRHDDQWQIVWRNQLPGT